MKSLSPKAGALLVVIAALIAGCRGPADYVPSNIGPDNGAPAGEGSPLLAHLDATKLKCPAPLVKVPGTYVVMSATGTLKNGRFVSAANAYGGIWSQVKYTAATPGPTASPTSLPSVPPEYLYYGRYTLKKSRQTGCATLITTQSGKDFPGLSDNALADGAPVVRLKNVNLKIGTFGKLAETITGITPTSGHGTAVLRTSKGAPFDTATITIVGRLSLK